jgi:hypothetical protein
MSGGRRAGGLALLLLVLGALAGCGYSLHGTLPPHIRTIAVPVFRNRTADPFVAQAVSRAVVEAFSTSGRLRVVPPEQADALLEGELVGYEIQSIAFDPRANVQLHRLLVTLDLRLRDLRQGRVLFERRGIRERADFRVAPVVAQTIAREEVALGTAAGDIARAVVALTIDGF